MPLEKTMFIGSQPILPSDIIAQLNIWMGLDCLNLGDTASIF